jgi:hypothetical protein
MQPLNNLPALHGTRRFFTAFTRGLHWSLSWARQIQSTPPYLSKTSQYFSLAYVLVFLVVSFLLVFSPIRVLLPISAIFHSVKFKIRLLTSANSKMSWAGAVGIAIGNGPDERRVGIQIPIGSRIFTF